MREGVSWQLYGLILILEPQIPLSSETKSD
jgi:hypothetical protein